MKQSGIGRMKWVTGRPWVLLCLSVIATVLLTGGGVSASPSKRIALILKARENAFYDAIVLGAGRSAAKYDMDVVTYYGQNENDWQSQVQYLRDNISRFDGFILVPNRSDAFGDVLRQLNARRKPVIIVDTPLSEGEECALTVVSSDNVAGGRLAGHFIAEQLKEREKEARCIVLFSGNPEARTHLDRNNGFVEVMHETQPHAMIHVFNGMSSMAVAREEAARNLPLLKSCGVVFAGSDTMILGVLAAFEERGMTPPPIMVGYDAILEAQRRILEGSISASVQQLPEEMGRVAVETLHDSFTGRPVQKKVLIAPRLSVRRFQLDVLSTYGRVAENQ